MYLPYTLQDNKMSSSAFIGKGLRKEEFMETQKEIKPISSDSCCRNIATMSLWVIPFFKHSENKNLQHLFFKFTYKIFFL